jgi:hypothetical protein
MKITETVTTIVSLLGGPQFNADDIDWALDLPAGQRLLEWLVSQVDELSADDGMNGSDALRAALQAISLEEDEVQMFVLHYLRGIWSDEVRLRHATRKAATAERRTATGELKSVPSGYIPPWRLRYSAYTIPNYSTSDAAEGQKRNTLLLKQHVWKRRQNL